MACPSPTLSPSALTMQLLGHRQEKREGLGDRRSRDYSGLPGSMRICFDGIGSLA